MNRTIALALAASIHQAPAEAQSAAPSPTEQQLLQRMQAREDARGWRSFSGSTFYAWKEWKLIAPGVRATAWKTEPFATSFGLLPGGSGTISVSCPKLALRYWESGGLTRWGRSGKPAQWGGWINAGSPESTPDADAMVAALCANVSGAAPAGQGGR